MAKIDISAIEGYEAMSAEEKLAALEAFEIPEPDYTGFVKKELFDLENFFIQSCLRRGFFVSVELPEAL